MSPRETQCEKPIRREVAQSSTAVNTAPDWATKARLPARGGTWAKLALRATPGTITPRQLGPMMRSRWGRAAASIASVRARPAAEPPSPNPAVMTTAALQPRRPSSSTRPGTVSGGVAMTARSGVRGREATSG